MKVEVDVLGSLIVLMVSVDVKQHLKNRAQELCEEHYIQVNMYHVRAEGVDKRMINVHYYY